MQRVLSSAIHFGLQFVLCAIIRLKITVHRSCRRGTSRPGRGSLNDDDTKDQMDGMRCLVRRLFVHPSMPSCVLVLCPRVTAIGAAYLALAKSTTDRSSDGDADKHRGMQTEGRTQTMKIGELKATAHHPFVRPFVRPSVR